ncbi:MAG: DeoR/GlpR transcriptional regulator [Erysipelotrichaceae bacterium]|nr:DeoR/GlpR transcriptional regulator [Erysipelotrichaceae bacterium]
MNKRERMNRIMQLVNENGTINNSDIIQLLNVSDMTIRRDLDELEKAGRLIRFHGGAQSVNYNLDFELSMLEKTTVNMEQKKQIAAKAASLVEEGDCIFLGPGTTIEVLASALAGQNITVVTNSLSVYNMLAERPETRLILAGGMRRKDTGFFADPVSNRIIGSIFFDKAFVSCSGLSPRDLTTSTMEEAETLQIALRNSKSCWLLADLSKFHHVDRYAFCPLTDLDGILVNGPMPESLLRRFEASCTIIEV